MSLLEEAALGHLRGSPEVAVADAETDHTRWHRNLLHYFFNLFLLCCNLIQSLSLHEV
jgi:hypothetical protein